MWDIKQKEKIKTNKQNNKLTDRDNRLVVTSGERRWEEGKMCVGGKMYGDGYKLDFGDEHAIVYKDIELQGCTPET